MRYLDDMKLLPPFALLSLLFSPQILANCSGPVDLLAVGDSQIGATWSRSYFGNFLPTCLKGNFIIYGRGATTLGNWLNSGGMDHIETIQRDNESTHINLGANQKVPICKKRIEPMLTGHQPRKVLFEFGGNYISNPSLDVKKNIEELMALISKNNISAENCYFLTPTFEMEVESRRSVPQRNLTNVQIVTEKIQTALAGRCQHISGIELMKSSPYFDGKELLKRIPIQGLVGCTGAASNDNVHVCGEAAKDLAERVCQILND